MFWQFLSKLGSVSEKNEPTRPHLLKLYVTKIDCFSFHICDFMINSKYNMVCFKNYWCHHRLKPFTLWTAFLSLVIFIYLLVDHSHSQLTSTIFALEGVGEGECQGWEWEWGWGMRGCKNNVTLILPFSICKHWNYRENLCFKNFFVDVSTIRYFYISTF